MGSQTVKADHNRVDPTPMPPRPLKSLRTISPEEIEQAMTSARFERLDSGRWQVHVGDYPDFSSQGMTREECEKLARQNLKSYLEHRPDPRSRR